MPVDVANKFAVAISSLTNLEELNIRNNGINIGDTIQPLLKVVENIVVLDISYNINMTLPALAIILNQARNMQNLSLDFNSLISMDLSLGLPKAYNSSLNTLNIHGELATDAAHLNTLNTILIWLLQNTHIDRIYQDPVINPEELSYTYYNSTIARLLMCNENFLDSKESMLGLVMACRRNHPLLFLPTELWHLVYQQLLDSNTAEKQELCPASNTI